MNEVYPLEQLMDAAVAMAKSFAVNAPIAVKYSKACIDRGMQMDIDDGIALENELFAMCFATEDQKEGMSAFLEKRKEKHFQNKQPVFPERRKRHPALSGGLPEGKADKGASRRRHPRKLERRPVKKSETEREVFCGTIPS